MCQGARTISELLMYNTTLTSLDLRGNALGNDGAIILGRGIKAMESVKLSELDLGYNEIKDDGACALANVRDVIYMFCREIRWCLQSSACTFLLQVYTFVSANRT